jgi:hypothetical protein
MLILYGGVMACFSLSVSPFVESPAYPFIGSRGGRDVEDETVKRPRILWHADLASLLIGGWSRLGRGRVEVGRRGMDKAEP